MLPPEREVDCTCEVPLARPVGFEPTGRNWRVTACLRCGVVTVVEAMVEEPHPHDVRCVANVPLEMNPKLLAWLAAWPRVGGSYKDWKNPFFLPASLQASDEPALEAVERAERAAPHVKTWARPFALELLVQRPTFTTDVAELLRSTDSAHRIAGAELVIAFRLATPEILDALAHWLDETRTDAPDLHRALDAAITLEQKARFLRAPLDRFATRIGKADYYLTRRVLQVRDRVAPK